VNEAHIRDFLYGAIKGAYQCVTCVTPTWSLHWALFIPLATRDDREGKRQVKIAQLDGECPFDRMGLIWLLNGDRLLAMRGDRAIIEAKRGSRLTFRN
jgi:hypothetical protein